jgi:sugar phosphate isomerase/epimerase
MAKIPVALQLYSVRGECKDIPATLKAVAKIGYVGVEPWGYRGDAVQWMGASGKDLRRMLDDNGLKCCGMHIATDALLGDNLARTIQLNRELGNKFVIIAGDKQRMSSMKTIKELAQILERAADKLKPEGMLTGYHAHPFDFEKVEGQTAWDILFSSTRKDIVMQMDIGNCAGGGGDPVAILKKFPGRALTVHLKDYGGPEESVIGEGKANWPEIFRLCETTHKTQWYVVEEGGKDGLGFDVSARSFQALRKLGKC